MINNSACAILRPYASLHWHLLYDHNIVTRLLAKHHTVLLKPCNCTLEQFCKEYVKIHKLDEENDDDQDDPIEDEVEEEIVTNAAAAVAQTNHNFDTLLSQLSLFAHNNQRTAFSTMSTNRPSKQSRHFLLPQERVLEVEAEARQEEFEQAATEAEDADMAPIDAKADSLFLHLDELFVKSWANYLAQCKTNAETLCLRKLYIQYPQGQKTNKLEKEESSNNELLEELIKKKVNEKTMKIKKELNKLKNQLKNASKNTQRNILSLLRKLH